MKRRFPFLQFHEYPPVYSLRVHWVPLFPSSQRLGAFAIIPHPGVHGFPVRRLLCPIRLSPEASSFREAFPPHDFPTALSIVRSNYAASCAGCGAPNFASSFVFVYVHCIGFG